MFMIKPKNRDDWAEAIEMLSTYTVKCTVWNTGGTYMKVDVEDDSQNELHLVEMYFQGAWHSESSRLCPYCTALVNDGNEIGDVCGHLTFNKPINSAF